MSAVCHRPRTFTALRNFQNPSGDLPGFQFSGFRSRRWEDFDFNAGVHLAACQCQVIGHLHLHPKVGGSSEVPGETERGIRGDTPALSDNFGDACNGYTQRKGQSFRRKAERNKKILTQKFAWMDWDASLVMFAQDAHSGTP